jgi:hypothetical protein
MSQSVNREHGMTDLSVADLTVTELRALIREVVTETITSLFVDSDEGLELREEFEAELRLALQRPAEEQQTESLEDVLRELGLG